MQVALSERKHCENVWDTNDISQPIYVFRFCSDVYMEYSVSRPDIQHFRLILRQNKFHVHYNDKNDTCILIMPIIIAGQ